ncbi:ABC transporter ATP-binding protein [Acidimicrobiales bacterium]|jgi:neutral amino acid transport system ATP-binding protein|nr:ABC transporter ATP-binding protein [Acidimicrobiales bacterium]MDC1390344.1 ABC transporter ATP-binding protein [Acidimicrobiales bacterium]MDG1086724.1 ABC transporter ATP-binding protein [Acidimicrobiales bacterium]
MSAKSSGNPSSAAKEAAAELLATVDPQPGSEKPDTILSVKGVIRNFGGLKAVDVDYLEVQRGIITAFIGPNGAGKTTFFNLLTGFDEPDTGNWQFDGTELSGMASHKIAQMGMVRTFQLTKSLGKMSVMDNMLLGAPNQKGEKLSFSLLRGTWRKQEADVRERAVELLERFNMSHMAEEYAATLSGGQRKLLEMARALMASPALILLDEPMAGVNPALVQSLLGHVEALRDDGVSVLFVEHDMDVIMGISDWIVVLAEGGVIAEGTPAQVSKNKKVIDAYLGTDDGIAADDGRTGADAQ